MVMPVAGKRLQKDSIPEEKSEMGIYAPMRKPEAAERIPRKAALAEELLINKRIAIKTAVEEMAPRIMVPKSKRSALAVR